MSEHAMPGEITQLVSRWMARYGIEPLRLNPENVPVGLRSFVPEASLLGIGDDGVRTEIAYELPASYATDLLERLYADPNVLNDWLTGAANEE